MQEFERFLSTYLESPLPQWVEFLGGVLLSLGLLTPNMVRKAGQSVANRVTRLDRLYGREPVASLGELIDRCGVALAITILTFYIAWLLLVIGIFSGLVAFSVWFGTRILEEGHARIFALGPVVMVFGYLLTFFSLMVRPVHEARRKNEGEDLSGKMSPLRRGIARTAAAARRLGPTATAAIACYLAVLCWLSVEAYQGDHAPVVWLSPGAMVIPLLAPLLSPIFKILLTALYWFVSIFTIYLPYGWYRLLKLVHRRGFERVAAWVGLLLLVGNLGLETFLGPS